MDEPGPLSTAVGAVMCTGSPNRERCKVLIVVIEPGGRCTGTGDAFKTDAGGRPLTESERRACASRLRTAQREGLPRRRAATPP